MISEVIDKKEHITLSNDLLLYIVKFIEIPFDKSIDFYSLFTCYSTKPSNDLYSFGYHQYIYIYDYEDKKIKNNTYLNLFNSCKFLHSLKKDCYIIFNKKYSKKFKESKEFRKEVHKKINIKNILFLSRRSIEVSFLNINIESDVLENYYGKEILLYKEFIKKIAYKEVFEFMKLEYNKNTIVTKSDLYQKILDFLNNERNNNNLEIFKDCRTFRLTGDLKILFDFIKKQMIFRGDLKNPEDFPEYFKYVEIIKYLKYCFEI
jgi:hypothetical protein